MGYKIREYREKKGLTQDELASRSGVGRVTISLIETGVTRNVSSQTLLKLAKALDVKVDELFFDASV